ncbi:MAG: TrmH family RNA methyltransferase [Bacteroidetes bacterium]|nr:TrmH family RNA methyltransferase [Bacteroidota bacterium]
MKHTQLTYENHSYSGKKHPLAFMLDNITSPNNIGSAFRFADALGVEKMYLVGKTLCPPNNRITKTARSKEKEIPWEYYETVEDALQKVKNDGYSIVSAEITDNSKDLSQCVFDTSKKICIVAGSERHGVSQEILDSSDEVVHIPMVGKGSSMNVVVALAIVTYEVVKQMKRIV